MGMSQMCSGAGDYFRTSKPHSEKLWLAIDLKKSLELPTLEDQKYQINTPIAALSAAQFLWTSSIVASMSAAASQPLNFILWHCSGSEPQFKDQCQGFKIFDAVFQPCVFWLRHFLFAVWTLSGEARRNVLVFVLIAKLSSWTINHQLIHVSRCLNIINM